jgi:hypothetical protein
MSFQIRLFLGYVQNKELKVHLNQSIRWKEAKLLGEATLIETQWQDKEYIGLFIPPIVTLPLIKDKEESVKTQLQVYCPKINLDKHSILIFSQLFII